MATKKTTTPRLSVSPRAVLPGSEKKPFVQAAAEKPAPSGTKITVSVVVRRKNPLKVSNRTGKERLTHAQYRQQHGADPDAVKLVRAFAKEYGLTVAPDAPALSAAPSNSSAPSLPCRRPSASPSSTRHTLA